MSKHSQLMMQESPETRIMRVVSSSKDAGKEKSFPTYNKKRPWLKFIPQVRVGLLSLTILLMLSIQGFAQTKADPHPHVLSCQANFTPHPDSSGFGVYYQNQSAGNSTFFSWSFGDNTYSNLQNPHHTYANAGNYAVCLTISDSSQTCTDTYCSNVVIASGSGGCQAYFTDSVDASGLGYYFTDVSYTNPVYWFWNFGDGNNSTQQNPFHQYANTGTYSVCLTIMNSNSTCIDTICQTISIGACHAAFYSFPDSSSIGSGGISFVNISNVQASSQTWDFGDSTTSTSPNPYHIFAVSGWYMVTLTINTSLGSCSTTDSVHAFRLTSAVPVVLDRPLDIKVFPNPFSNSFHVDYTLAKQSEISICLYDLQGRVVAILAKENQPQGSHSVIYDTGGLASGTYQLVVRAGESLAVTKLSLLK